MSKSSLPTQQDPEKQQQQRYIKNQNKRKGNAAEKQHLLNISPPSATIIPSTSENSAQIAGFSGRYSKEDDVQKQIYFAKDSGDIYQKSEAKQISYYQQARYTFNNATSNIAVAGLPPPSPTYSRTTQSIVRGSSNYVDMPSQSHLTIPTPFFMSNFNYTNSQKLPSPTSPALEETLNRRKTCNLPLHSFAKLNNIRKKSISEISLILEVIRSAAKPSIEDISTANTQRSNQRVVASASPYPVKSKRSSPLDTQQLDMEINKSNAINLRRTSQSATNLLAQKPETTKDSIENRQNSNFLNVAQSTLQRQASCKTAAGGSRSLSPTLSRISAFLRQKKGNSHSIRWERLSPHHIHRQMIIVQEEKAMQLAPTSPIDASKFVVYVQERRKKRILFKGEYLVVLRSIDPQKCTTTIGALMGERNQYPDTLPYDYNRVVLHTSRETDVEEPYLSYINASYVQSWLHERAYIVTQAVKTKQASNQFWRLVWEMRSNCIVMLTKVFDFMRVMCLQYWPIGKFQFGEIEVETLETKSYAHFVIRTFSLRHVIGVEGEDGVIIDSEPRIVKHFHFTEWELNSFPYISAFIELRRRVRQWTDQNRTDAPIIVHCSNGGGRSGAFLALDANLELLSRTNQVNVFEYCKTLVNARQHLIDSVEQYTFIYDVLCEALLCNIQPIAMHQLKDRSSMYKSKKDRELMEIQDSHENKLLLMLTPTLRIGDCAGGHRLENRGKNRDVMVVPPDHARPYLQTLHGESKDYTYINAVEVDGFTRKSEFIVTEWPKQQTLDSFWTLIFDHSVHTVINLTNQQSPHSKLYPPFIHSKGKKNYGPFMIEILNHQQYPGLCSYMVKITKRPTDSVPMKHEAERAMNKDRGQVSKLTFMISEIMSSNANQQQIDVEIRICCVIQVKMWPIENKVPLSTSSLIDLIRMMRAWRKRAPDRPETKPTIVMSHNGVSRCGIFIGANVCIDQMDMDHEVDVFHAVKMIRLNRPQLIDMKDEYKYLYDLMLHWYMNNPEYRVYEPPEQSPLQDHYEDDEEDTTTVTHDNADISLITRQLSRSRIGSRRRTTLRNRSLRSNNYTPTSPTNTTPPDNSLSRSSSGKKQTIYLN